MWRTDALLCDCHGRWISGKEATDVRLDVGDTMKKWNARRKCGPHRTLHSPSHPPTAHPLPPPTRDGVAQSHRATHGDGALRIRTMPQRSAQRSALSGPHGNGRSTQRKCWRRSGHRTELSDGTGTGRDGTQCRVARKCKHERMWTGRDRCSRCNRIRSAATGRLWIARRVRVSGCARYTLPRRSGRPAAAAVCCTAHTTPVSHWAGPQRWCYAAAS
jgi:hypothetical protein